MLQTILIASVIAFIVIVLIFEFSSLMTYGKYLSNEEVESYINKWNGDFEKNPYDGDIITPTVDFNSDDFIKRISEPYIAKMGFPWCFGVYHIEDRGRIFRFSKGAKLVDEVFKNSKKSSLL